jgi:anti-anti-sigma factor
MPEFKIEKLPGSGEGVEILKLMGPFTISGVFDFQNIVRAGLAACTIVDLTEVPYMDSAALGSVIGLHVSCQHHGSKYALVSVSDRLKTLFRVAGVEGLLTICATVPEAEAKLAN